jgi:hypothetical protein
VNRRELRVRTRWESVGGSAAPRGASRLVREWIDEETGVVMAAEVVSVVRTPFGGTTSLPMPATPRDTASSITRLAANLLLREFAPNGRIDTVCAWSNRGPRAIWEGLEEGGIVSRRTARQVPPVKFAYDLTAYGRHVLREILRRRTRPAPEIAPEPERPAKVLRRCPTCLERRPMRVLERRRVACSCGAEWTTQFRKSEVA